jgi:hypothetical protein
VNLPGAVGTLPAAADSVNYGDNHDHNDIVLSTVMMMMMMMMIICHCVLQVASGISGDTDAGERCAAIVTHG